MARQTNHVVIYIFKFIVWRGNYFGRWSFDLYISSNENNLCHSARITFPGNIKGGVTLSLPLFSPDRFQQQADHTQLERAHSTFGPLFLSETIPSSFIHFLLWPTGPRNFWLNAQFLLNYLQLSFYLYDSQHKGFRLKLTLKILKLNQYFRRLICLLPSPSLN